MGILETKEAYNAYGFGLSGKFDITDEMLFDFNGMMTGQKFDDAYDADDDNIVDGYGYWEPVSKYVSVWAPSGVVSFKTTDPFGIGFFT